MDRLKMLGKRLICDECGTKYYDLNRNLIKCPRCGCTRTRKTPIKPAAPVPVALDIEADEDIKDDDMELEPLDDLEMDDENHDDSDGDGNGDGDQLTEIDMNDTPYGDEVDVDGLDEDDIDEDGIDEKGSPLI